MKYGVIFHRNYFLVHFKDIDLEDKLKDIDIEDKLKGRQVYYNKADS